LSNELATLNNLFSGKDSIVPTTTADEQAALAKLSEGSTFLKRLQLYSRGKAIDKDYIAKGHFGTPTSKEDIKDLGTSVDLIPLIRKAKAVDMSDRENIIVTNDVSSDEFKRICHNSDNTRDSGCVYGPSYLVYERSTGTFYEFFCQNKSARVASAMINSYLPVSEDMIKNGLTDEKKPRGPKAFTAVAKLVEKGDWTWHVPSIEDCLTPFESLPNEEQVLEEIQRFLKPEGGGVEAVDEPKGGRRR
jgi:hypothetical protein